MNATDRLSGPPQSVHDRRERPLRDLRISVTDKCNMRCGYCMPAEKYGEHYQFLEREKLLSFEEVERLTRIFANLGVTKVRLTGGEPLLRKGMTDLVRRIALADGVKDIALTTNGLLLSRFAQALKQAGLHRLTVSLDSLDPAVFAQMNGRGYEPETVLEGIEAAWAVGFSTIKINVVVQKGVNDHTLVELVERFKDRDVIIRFIEFMDVGNCNSWNMDEVVSSADIIDRIAARFPLVPIEQNYRGEVAQRFRFRDGKGEIGVISSVSNPFCGECTRARLSAEGKLYTCLFASDGLDLRAPLRGGASDAEITRTIRERWSARDDRYSEIRAQLKTEQPHRQKVEMYQIGG